jgi:hypothetical protein
MLGIGVLGIGLVVASALRTDGSYYFGKRRDTSAPVGWGIIIVSSLWSMIDAPISSARINRKNGWTLVPVVTERLYVGVDVSKVGTEHTPMVKAVLTL